MRPLPPARGLRPGARTAAATREPGQIMVLFALVMVVLLGAAAIVVDLGLLRTDKARLQNALDAAALAAAHSMPATSANVASVRSVATTFTQQNMPGAPAPTVTFRCLIGYDTVTGLPRVGDMPSVCKVSLAANAAAWRCTDTVCWAPCDPSVTATDVCNTVEVGDSTTRQYGFGPAVGVNSGSTGSMNAAACTGACGGAPTTPVDLVIVLDRTLSMSGDEANLRNAAKAVLGAYDPAIQHVALAMLGPSSLTTACASGVYGEPYTATTLQAPGSGTTSSYVQSSTGTSAGATSITVNRPTGLAVGDLLLAAVSIDGGTGASITAAPAGWTLLGGAKVNSTTNVGQAVYWRVATATDVAASGFTWSINTAKRMSAAVMRVTGVDTANPIAASTVNQGTGTTLSASGLTAPDQALVVGFFTSDTNTAFTATGTPASSRLQANVSVTNSNAAGPATLLASRSVSAGATGSRTFTTSGTAGTAWIAQLVAVNPTPAESYSTSYPVTAYPAGLARWIPVGLTGTSDAQVVEAYRNNDGTLNTSSQLVRGIECVQPGHLYAGTDLATPMEFAWKYLRDYARPGVKTGIIFETDGTPQTSNYTCAQATTAANAAKAAGVEVFTIGFSLTSSGGTSAPVCPDNSGRTALTQLASMATDSASTSTTQCDANENTDGDHFFCQPAGADLTAVFRSAALAFSTGIHLVQLYPQPVVTSVSPAGGSKAGGTSITIGGSYFTDAWSVTVGGVAVTSFTVVNDTTITARVPAAAATGTVDVVVSTPGGASATVVGDRFTYTP